MSKIFGLQNFSNIFSFTNIHLSKVSHFVMRAFFVPNKNVIFSKFNCITIYSMHLDEPSTIKRFRLFPMTPNKGAKTTFRLT